MAEFFKGVFHICCLKKKEKFCMYVHVFGTVRGAPWALPAAEVTSCSEMPDLGIELRSSKEQQVLLP